MENPATWNKVEEAIAEAMGEHAEDVQNQVCGLSDVARIYIKLQERGFLKPEFCEHAPVKKNLALANTKIGPEEIQDSLREKCNRAGGSEGPGIDLSYCSEVDKIREGLKRVSFDFENYECTQGSHIGKFKNLLGPRYFGKIPAVGCAAGGDWEYPVFFIIYMDRDGASLRSYVPKDGNTWNYETGSAFGNDEISDPDFLVNWANSNKIEISPEIIRRNPTDCAEIMFDENKIIKDIEDNIQTD